MELDQERKEVEKKKNAEERTKISRKVSWTVVVFFSLKEMVADLDTGKTLLKSINISGNVTCFDGKSGWN